MKPYPLKPLGDMSHLETPAVLRAAISASEKLGELKGFVRTVPNEAILLNTLPLQESKASSEIENIVTTHDELFRGQLNTPVNSHAREVRHYEGALLMGFKSVQKNEFLRLQDVLDIQQAIVGHDAGLRTQTGTTLKDSQNRVVYTPPEPQQIPELMANLLAFMNDIESSQMNTLAKMAIAHYQFESIHPFYDGNGRTGRILNLLHLTLTRRLDLPVLYLSRFIIASKQDYYRLLQGVRDQEDWQSWLLYMLQGIERTAEHTIELVEAINRLLSEYKHRMREEAPRLYSQDLLNALFSHPYTTISHLQRELGCAYLTARTKLKQLVELGYLDEQRLGTRNFYVNTRLCDLLVNG